jgi:2-methylcitrate dehydratase PrpD
MEASEVESIWADMGSRWYVSDQYIKLYPVCRWAQPPVEAVLALQRLHGFEVHDIAAIHVDTFHEARRLCTRHPKTTEEAQYSLPFSVATALVHGTIEPEHVDGVCLSNADAAHLQDLIEIRETDEFNIAFPRKRIASATVQLTDGRMLVSPATEAKGDPENPVSKQAIDAKFRTFTEPVLGKMKSENMLDLITDLPETTSAVPLVTALAAVHNS